MNNTDTLKRAEIDPRPVPGTDVGHPGETAISRSDTTPLFPPQITGEFTDRWTEVQTAFVDDPRAAVQQADELVAFAIRKLSESFSDERARLESQWSRGGDVSTEDLRLALQRYRSFFHRLLHL